MPRQPVLDTYQYDEVVKAIKTRIRDVNPGCQRIDLSIYGPERYIEKYGYTVRPMFGLDADTQYDGSNLDAVVKDCKLELTAYFAENDLAESPLTKQLEAWNTEGRFVAFDTGAHLSAYLENSRSSPSAALSDEVLYAPYITQIREFDIESHSSVLTNYQLHEGDGFLYCCPAFPEVRCMEPEHQTEGAACRQDESALVPDKAGGFLRHRPRQ